MAEDKKIDIPQLILEVDSLVEKVHTQSLDISFNELADMVQTGELDISPDYQRLFQWSEGARSRFIESLLLEMPVPPIYVVEQDDNRKSLIDGLQRLSSYLHFRGLLSAEHLRPEPVALGSKLVLSDCDIIPNLNGLTFDDLGLALQIKLRRSFVRVEVVKKGSNPKFKYHMFKRLNTGGEALSPQQLRNCTIRLLSPVFNDFLIKCSKIDGFKNCISSISDEQFYAAYDVELVLRFFALKNNISEFKHDVSDFLTEYMEKVSDPEVPFDLKYEEEEHVFVKTFSILNETLGDKSFSRANKAGDGLISGFGVYHFEAICIGMQPYLDAIDVSSDEGREKFKDVLISIKVDDEFIALTTGGGKNSPGLLRQRIKFVADRIGRVY